jgi:HEAT repeat protein
MTSSFITWRVAPAFVEFYDRNIENEEGHRSPNGEIRRKLPTFSGWRKWIMKSLILLLALGNLLVGVVGQAQDYKGRALTEWKARTRPEFSLAERREAVGALVASATNRLLSHLPNVQPDDVRWIESEITPVLIELLHDKDPTMRAFAASRFPPITKFTPEATKEAVPALTVLLGDADEKVRSEAAWALTSRGRQTEPSIPALSKAVLQDASPVVRFRAACALRTTGSKGIDRLLAILDDSSAEARAAAGRVLANHTPVGPTPIGAGKREPLTPEQLREAAIKLVRVLGDERREVRITAALAIVDMNPVPKEVLKPLLGHKDADVRHAAGRGLLNHEPERLRDELLQFAKSDMDFCRKVARPLWRLGPPSIPILVKLLDDENPHVRADAADALGEHGLGDAAKDAVPALKRLLHDRTALHPDTPIDRRDRPEGGGPECVSHHAGRALTRILGEDYSKGLPRIYSDAK